MRISAEEAKSYICSMANTRGMFDRGFNPVPYKKFEDGDDLVFLALFAPSGNDFSFVLDDLGLKFKSITGSPGEFKVIFDKKSLRLKEIVVPDNWKFSKPMRN